MTVVNLVRNRYVCIPDSQPRRSACAALFLKAELPSAILAFRCFGRTMQALRMNTGVDSPGEGFKFDDAHALAREIWKPFAAAGFLHPANVHEKAQAFSVLRPFHPLRVDDGIHSQSQRLLQRLEAALLRDVKSSHDAARLSRSESLPGARIQIDGSFHPQAFFRRQEPTSIVRQPVLGEHVQRAQKVLAAHQIESCLSVITHVRFTPAHFALVSTQRNPLTAVESKSSAPIPRR